MNELSLVTDLKSEKTVTTKELAEVLGVDVKTIQRVSGKLFDINVVKSVSTGGRPTQIFNEAQATAIKIELQNHSKIAQNGFNTLTINNDVEMLILQKRLTEYQDRRIAELTQIVEQQKPKAEFYDCVTGSKDTVDMKECAKVINFRGWGRNKIFELLRQKSVLDRSNQPYQRYCDMQYFRIIESKYVLPTGEVKISLKTVVYQKGLDFIRKLIEKEENEHKKPLKLLAE